MAIRKQRLLDSLQVQQLFRDIEDEEAWIREKEPIAAGTTRGRDLIGVQNLIKKHQAVLAEINNHDGRIGAVVDAGKQMMEDEHFASDQIRNRVNALYDHWVQLKEKANQRKQDLDDSLQAHQYYADANEAESWMKEKEPIVNNTDYGKDEDSSEALLKKHEALMSDLIAFGNTIEGLKEQARNCRVRMKCVQWFFNYFCRFSNKNLQLLMSPEEKRFRLCTITLKSRLVRCR
jgi:spectrin alpha